MLWEQEEREAMGRRPQQPLRALSGEEQDTWERLVKASSARRDQARGARAVCAVARGSSYGEAGGLAGRGQREPVGVPVQGAGAGGVEQRARARAQSHLWREGAGARGGDGAADARAGAGWHGHLVALDTGADRTERGGTPDRGDEDPAGAARGGEFVPTHAHMVPDGDRSPHAHKWSRPGHRSRQGGQKGRIEQA